MLTINMACEIEDVIKKSRFIGFIYPCQSEAEIVECLEKLRSEHPGANHIVFAYRIKTEAGIISRFYDAGEPSGTAGKPVYSYIEGYDLINVLVVVVRYFGGIKLGAGGLTRAYGQSAKHAIEAAEILDFIEYALVEFILDYKQFQSFEYHLPKFSGKIIDKEFAGQITLHAQLPIAEVENFFALFSGRILEQPS